MAFVMQAGFDVEITGDDYAERDIYRLVDLPIDLKELVKCQRSREELVWFSPDGAQWRVRPAFV